MRIILTISILLIFISANGQNIHFYKSYGNSGYDFGRDIVQTVDTGYIATGSSSSFASQNADAFLLKIDSTGAFEWSNNYGGNGSDWSESVVFTNDSAYSIAGYTNSFGNGGFDFYLVKTSITGAFEWEKTFGGSDWDQCFDHVQLNDSGYVLVGETHSFGSGGTDGYIIRTNKFGDTLWTNTFGGVLDDRFNAILLDGDSLVVVGSTESFGAGESDGWLLKFHIDGTLGWEQYIGKPEMDYFTSIRGYDNYYVLGGSYTLNSSLYNNDFWVYKISTDGQTVFADTSWTGEQFGVDIVNDIEIDTLNSDIYYGGSTTSWGNPDITQGVPEAFISILNSAYGWAFYVQNFGAEGIDVLHAMDLCYDRGLVGIGDHDFYSTGGSNMFIVRIDKNNSFGLIEVENVYDLDSITLSTGISENASLNSRIYPNPFTGFISIDNHSKITSIWISDVQGKIVYNSVNPTQTIDLCFLSNGIYQLTYEIDNQLYTEKIVKY